MRSTYSIGYRESECEDAATEHGAPSYLLIDLPAAYAGDTRGQHAVFQVQAYSHRTDDADFFCLRAARIVTIDATIGRKSFAVQPARDRSQHHPHPRPAGDFERTWNAVQVTVTRHGFRDDPVWKAKFGPVGSIRMRNEDVGIGLGSYLMSRVVEWLVQNHPDVPVEPGKLSDVDGVSSSLGPENLERRNRFYASPGFSVETDDAGNGRFWAERADELRPSWDEDRLTEVSALDYAHRAAAALAAVSDEAARLNRVIAAIEPDANAFFRLQRLGWALRFWGGWAAVLAGMIALAWWRHGW